MSPRKAQLLVVAAVVLASFGMWALSASSPSRLPEWAMSLPFLTTVLSGVAFGLFGAAVERAAPAAAHLKGRTSWFGLAVLACLPLVRVVGEPLLVVLAGRIAGKALHDGGLERRVRNLMIARVVVEVVGWLVMIAGAFVLRAAAAAWPFAVYAVVPLANLVLLAVALSSITAPLAEDAREEKPVALGGAGGGSAAASVAVPTTRES